MTSSFDTPGPGRNIAFLRKAHDMSQTRLAREAGISLSLLSKVEVGDRALNQGVASALAKALGVTLDEVLGKASVSGNDETKLDDLRSVIRRFELPDDPPDDPATLGQDLAKVVRLRGHADLAGLLNTVPDVLAKATNHAHANGTPEAWSTVADVYSAVYYLAARHRWMDLAELAVTKQGRAAERSTSLVQAIAVRDEAGAFLNSGDFTGGLAVVERGVIRAESSMEGQDRSLALGILHLRGMTLAGRASDRAEAERHIDAAWRNADNFDEDIRVPHGITFGPENTANHCVATAMDLEKPRQALNMWNDMSRGSLRLPPTRQGHLHLNVARAKLATHDRDAALDSLVNAWDVTPQMAKVHPTSQELMRVLVSLHKRSNPTLTRLAKKAGIRI